MSETIGDPQDFPEELIGLRDELLSEGAARRELGKYDDIDVMRDQVANDPVALRAYKDAVDRRHQNPQN